MLIMNMRHSCILISLLMVCIVMNGFASTMPHSTRWTYKFGLEKLGCRTCTVASKVSSVGVDSVTSAGASFLKSLPLTVPISMALNVGKLPDINGWLLASVKEGTDMARMSAVFSGGQTLMRNIREKDDRFNIWVGSGLANAFVNLKDGPFAMAKGFGQGFGIIYAFDKASACISSFETDSKKRLEKSQK